MKQTFTTHKLATRIFLLIICGLCIALGVLALWQRENILLVINAQRYSKTEILAQLAENEAELRQAVLSVPGVTIREPTDEEVAQLKNGQMDEQTFIKRLLDKPKNDVAVSMDVSVKPPSAERIADIIGSSNTNYQEQLDLLIAQAYALKVVFIGRLDNLLSQAKVEYWAIPKAQRTGKVSASLAAKYIGHAGSLEETCDKRMDTIITQVKQVLKQNNISSSLPQDMAYAYANEKSLQKSYYLSYMK